MLYGEVSIGSMSGVMGQLDAMKSKFLAVPQRISDALDKLHKAQDLASGGGAPASVMDQALQIENALEQVRYSWNSASIKFQELQQLRQQSPTFTLEQASTAGALLASAYSVMSTVDSKVAAVDSFARAYLTPEQQQRLNVGPASSGMPIVALALLGGAVLFFANRSRKR